MLALLTAGALTNGHEPGDSAERKAAHEIALKYKCDLVSVLDRHQEPTTDFIRGEDPEGRTIIDINLALEDNPHARQHLARYDNGDNTVWWPQEDGTPKVEARVHPNSEPGDYDKSAEFSKPYPNTEYTSDHSLHAIFAPQATYPDGTQASVYVLQPAVFTTTAPTEFTEGRTYCGELVFENGEWTMKDLADDVRPADTIVTKYTQSYN